MIVAAVSDEAATVPAVTITEHLRPGQLADELAKVEQPREPPVPVEVFFLDDWHPGVLHGWAASPRGGPDGLWGLVRGLREYAAGFEVEFCTWATAEAIRQR